MSYNNTYGIQAVNETVHHKHMWDLYKNDGYLDKVKTCRKLVKDAKDEYGDIDEVNGFCSNVSRDTSAIILDYLASGKYGWFDITHPRNDPFPSNYELGYLNQHWVQKALGVPVNHSWAAEPVAAVFSRTGDHTRGGIIEDLADLLDRGVKVHLMYGDRDYACNWIGGEAASLAIPYKHQEEFGKAGYAPLTVSDGPPFVSYGLTRQHGNFSFTRVYQAGHMVPSYQPEASYQIFSRSLFNKDIATGKVDLTRTGGWASQEEDEIFRTNGPLDTWWKKNDILSPPEPECYVLDPGTCTEEEYKAVGNGTAIVKDWIVVGRKDQSNQPEVSRAEGTQILKDQVFLGAAEEL